MLATYSQIQLHIVFAVKYRQNLIDKKWSDELYKYICSIINAKKQKCLIVNGVSDHIHILLGLRPSIACSDLVRDIKNNSSKFINQNNWVKGRFAWQEGYGVFSISESHIDRVYRYIANQEAHHAKTKFKSEFLDLLEQHHLESKDDYLFDWIL
jgi:putative transposase